MDYKQDSLVKISRNGSDTTKFYEALKMIITGMEEGDSLTSIRDFVRRHLNYSDVRIFDVDSEQVKERFKEFLKKEGNNVQVAYIKDIINLGSLALKKCPISVALNEMNENSIGHTLYSIVIFILNYK